MQIHWKGMEEVSARQRDEVSARIESLAEGYTDLIDVRITGRHSRHHRHGAREVKIICLARGRELIVTRERNEMGRSLHDALDAFEREVRKLRERRIDRRAETPPQQPHLGVVDRVLREEGYGFLITDAGDQIYFHRNALHGLDFDTLEEGARVGLNIEAGESGPQATVVTPAPPDAPSP